MAVVAHVIGILLVSVTPMYTKDIEREHIPLVTIIGEELAATMRDVKETEVIECKKPDNQYCVRYKKDTKYFCKQKWMSGRCVHMCGLCHIPKAAAPLIKETGRAKQECKKSDNQNCERYKKHAKYYCKQKWVAGNCAHMCGLCSIPKATALSPIERTSIKETKKAAPECKRSDSRQCLMYKDHKKYYCRQYWVRNNCADMCGLCRSLGATTSTTISAGIQRTTNLPECKKRDNDNCFKYKDDTKFYCKHKWVNHNCPRMCILCKDKELPALSPEQVPRQFAGDKPECKKVDSRQCLRYKDNKMYYCRQNWVSENCASMCELCTSFGAPASVPKSTPTYAPIPESRAATTFAPSYVTTSSPAQITSISTECKKRDNYNCLKYKTDATLYCKHQWVESNCPHMCTLCKECNKRDNHYCFKYKTDTKFYCKYQWVNNNCPHMCSLCKGNEEPFLSTQQGQQNHPGETSDCKNRDHKHCAVYKAVKRFYCTRSWVKEKCARMCHLCIYRKVTESTSPKDGTKILNYLHFLFHEWLGKNE